MPAAAEGVALLAMVCAFLVCYGLLRAYRGTLGWVFNSLADAMLIVRIPLGFKTIHPFGKVAAFLKSVNRNVEHALAAAAMRCENAVAWLFHQTWSQLQWVARELADLGQAVDRALGSVSINVVRPAVKVLDKQTVARIKALQTTLRRLSATTIGAINLRIGRLEHRVARMAATAAHALPSPFPRIKRAERRLDNQAKRLTKLERATIGAAALAVTATALKRAGLGWLKCDKVGRTGKAICGMNPNVFESILLDASLLTVAFNIETFARELQEITGEAAHLIRDFVE